jgi:hypothetical protein
MWVVTKGDRLKTSYISVVCNRLGCVSYWILISRPKDPFNAGISHKMLWEWSSVSCCVIFLVLTVVSTKLPARIFSRIVLNFSEKFKHVRIRIIFRAGTYFSCIRSRMLLYKLTTGIFYIIDFSIYFFQTRKLEFWRVTTATSFVVILITKTFTDKKSITCAQIAAWRISVRMCNVLGTKTIIESWSFN